MDLNIVAYLSALVLLAAVGAWMHVRLSAIRVKSRTVDFNFERLQFARKQHDFAEQQHKDMITMRREHMRTMGNLPSPMMGPGGPLGGPPRRRGPGEDMDS